MIPAPTTASVVDRAAATPRPSYKWWIVFMLWWVCFFNYADRQAIASIFPKLEAEFGFTKFQLGMIGSAFMWVYALGGPLAGYIGDRVRRKDLILGGCLFWSLVTVTTAWCSKLWQFVTVRALEGFGETFYFPASMAVVSDYHPTRTRSTAMSLHQSSVYAGTIAGSWLAAVLAEHFGWRSGFYFFGVCGVVLVLLLWRFVLEPARGQSEAVTESDPARGAAGSFDTAVFFKPSVVLLMLTFMGANFVATIFLTWTPTFLVEKFHFSLSAAGLSGSAFIHLASAITVPCGGALADALSRRHPGGRTFVQAAGLLVGSAFVFLIGTTNDRTTLLVAMSVFGAAKGLYDSNIFASLYDAVPPASRATAAGVMNTVGWGGGALGPLAVGYLARHGPRGTEIDNMSWAIARTGVIYLVGAALLLVVGLVFIRGDRVGSK